MSIAIEYIKGAAIAALIFEPALIAGLIKAL